MNLLRAPEHGELIKLGSPLAGEVIVVVDPGSTGSAFAAGTQTLLPGAELPVQRHLGRDVVLFVHKGQARATLDERVVNVVPGAMLHVSRNVWYGVRNTGTGALQIAWASSPPGLELFFREFSRLSDAPSAQALQELAQRHGIEFRPATEAPSVPEGRRHRGRRGGRRGRGGRAPTPSAASPLPSTLSPVSGAPSSVAPAAPAAPSAPGQHRRRHRRRGGAGRRSAPPAAVQGLREPSAGTAPVSPSAPTPRPTRPAGGRPRSGPPHRRRRVKEVYMGGRWVRVEGDGPVIAPGRQSERRDPKRGEDDEPPPIRLSVPL